MLEARLTSCATLKKVMESIKDLLTDAIFDCSGEGIRLHCMDNTHVCLISLVLKSDGFDMYRCDRNVSLGMNLISLSKILKCADNDDTIAIKVQQDDSNSVTFTLRSKRYDKISEYEMKLLNIDEEQLGIPEITYLCKIRMSSTEFAGICRDLSGFGETIVISCAKNGVVGFTAANILGSGNIELRRTTNSNEGEDSIHVDLQEPVRLEFASRYLISFTKATPLSTRVELSLSQDMPLLVQYEIRGLGNICYYLAPKIEDN